MATNVRYEDRLKGASNYLQWKVRIIDVFKEKKLWDFINTRFLVLFHDSIALYLHEVK